MMETNGIYRKTELTNNWVFLKADNIWIDYNALT